MALLEIEDLSVHFTQYTEGMRQSTVGALHHLRLSADAGEVTAIVGASGSGKSILCHALLGLLPDNARMSGHIRFDGELLTPARQEKLRGREIVLVPQSVTYLDPLMRVGYQVRHAVKSGDPARAQRAVFERLRLAREVERHYPFQLSGGMARRVLAATAAVSEARLIVADEPTPGLDPAVVREALHSFRELADRGSAVLLVSHDIESALSVADRVAVIYAGGTVEICPAADFAGAGDRLRHPYSRALWRSLPQNEFAPLPGSQPEAGAVADGCAFAPRCAFATEQCGDGEPEMRELRGGWVRCIHAS